MNLRRVSVRLALQFMAFVTLLLLVNGVVFIAADFRVTRSTMDSRLLQESHRMIERVPQFLSGAESAFPPQMRRRVRVLDSFGRTLFAGDLFEKTPFNAAVREISDQVLQDEEYRVVTLPIIRYGIVAGYLQMAGSPDIHAGDLPRRGIVLLLTSALVSGLTFLVGLFFARKNLKPVEETMERLEQFTQDASHELRTPLAVLGSSLDVALKTKKYREGIESAKEDLSQISVLVERLLELARLDTFVLESESVDLSGLVSQTAEKFSVLAAERGMTVAQEIAPGITTKGDAALVRQVLTNLLSNAVKFTATGGTVTVRLGKKTLTVSDTGIGIDAADLPHLFDRFYQADASRSRGGLGLGLALVKRITDLHGWDITVKSTPGQGTAFSVKFG